MKKEDLLIRKSFSIPHNDGEIWAEELDSLYNFEDVVMSKFMEDMKEIRRPSTPSNIAINLSQTVLTAKLAALIVGNLVEAGSSVRKVAFVGIGKEGIDVINNEMKNQDVGFIYRYFDDYAKAKDWLV